MYYAYKLNKQDDNIQPWCTSFPIWNESLVACPVVASWPAWRCLRRQVIPSKGHRCKLLETGSSSNSGTHTLPWRGDLGGITVFATYVLYHCCNLSEVAPYEILPNLPIHSFSSTCLVRNGVFLSCLGRILYTIYQCTGSVANLPCWLSTEGIFFFQKKIYLWFFQPNGLGKWALSACVMRILLQHHWADLAWRKFTIHLFKSKYRAYILFEMDFREMKLEITFYWFRELTP